MKFKFIFVLTIFYSLLFIVSQEVNCNENHNYDYRRIDENHWNSFQEGEESLLNILPNDNFNKKLEIIIETLIYTDYSVFELHKNILKNHLNVVDVHQNLIINHIKAYYTQIIQDVNNRYKESFKNDKELSIHVGIIGFNISTKVEDSPWSELDKYSLGYNSDNIRMINADLVLVDFNRWLESTHDGQISFDYAFAVTAYDMRNLLNEKMFDYNGLGYISGICKKYYRGALIEERGAYSSARSFAHELGHSLGASHDSDNLNESNECSNWQNFLMSSNFHLYNRKNSWKFSECSVNQIKKFLTYSSEHLYCLTNIPKHTVNSQIENINLHPGQIYNDREQCKQLFGVQSIPCFEYYSSFCEILYCRKNISDTACHFVSPSAEGTSCGNRMWCQRGECIFDKNAPQFPYEDEIQSNVNGRLDHSYQQNYV